MLPAFSEDFGSFQDRVPGVMYFLGVSNAAKGMRGMPHSPDYVADEGAILVGARAMVAVMLERMAGGPRTPNGCIGVLHADAPAGHRCAPSWSG